jgi:hypothetical protein
LGLGQDAFCGPCSWLAERIQFPVRINLFAALPDTAWDDRATVTLIRSNFEHANSTLKIFSSETLETARSQDVRQFRRKYGDSVVGDNSSCKDRTMDCDLLRLFGVRVKERVDKL